MIILKSSLKINCVFTTINLLPDPKRSGIFVILYGIKFKYYMNENVRWGVFIPRMGAGSFACGKVTGSKPLFALSLKDKKFQEIDQDFCNYWPDVPYYILEEKEPDHSLYKDIDFVFNVWY